MVAARFSCFMRVCVTVWIIPAFHLLSLVVPPARPSRTLPIEAQRKSTGLWWMIFLPGSPIALPTVENMPW